MSASDRQMQRQAHQRSLPQRHLVGYTLAFLSLHLAAHVLWQLVQRAVWQGVVQAPSPVVEAVHSHKLPQECCPHLQQWQQQLHPSESCSAVNEQRVVWKPQGVQVVQRLAVYLALAVRATGIGATAWGQCMSTPATPACNVHLHSPAGQAQISRMQGSVQHAKSFQEPLILEACHVDSA